ncbi:Aryl hydrocarbon receptor nuclear translocator-like protein 1 [Orchesella cincta]|uniref:Aryl hydrocarbon receptor nuclear translocator-like protein 1 n=1 Tax=Orchesella cincta TaxID=48709 RepID=A0A1D2NFC2_ORCCI|nr:Aryl hydrocarbon receptor nuclear translocator-like protein 1 [Orchesella cincta]
MRRDKLNTYISELSTLVPIVAMATKRMDKTSVLRLSANFLRIHLSLKQNQKKETTNKYAPNGLEAQLSSVLLDSMEGFMLIVTSSGKIVYVSDTVEKLLGHSQLDLMGQSLYTVCHNGDVELLRHHLQPSKPFDPTKDNDPESAEAVMECVPRSPSFYGGRPEEAMSGLSSGERRSFYIRLAERTMARGDPTRHVTVHMIGVLRPPSKKDDKKANKKKDCSSTTAGDEHLLVCVARPFRNKGITELSLMEAIQDEYVTRHLPDGRIIYTDHRIAFVAGYLTEEVMGMSAFNFIHQDDLPWATVANRQMFSSVEGQGYSVYRLRSKTGTLIYLRTRGYLEFNKTTQKVESFVCINTLLTSEEGDKELEKERERITPFITFQQVTTTSTNASSSNVLPSTPSSESIVSKIVTTLTTTTVSRKEKPQSTCTKDPNSSILPRSSVVEIAELPSIEEPSNAMSLITSPKLLNPGVVEHHHVNGDSLVDSQDMSVADAVPTISSPQVSTISMIHDMLDGATVDQIIHIPVSTTLSNGPTSLLPANVVAISEPPVQQSTRRDIMPTRLKRSFSEIEELMVTTSAKRAIVPTAFITSYGPLHHSPQLGSKWGTETATMIFDQHNNNG